MIKLKRYVYEFANDTIRKCEALSKTYPHNAEHFKDCITKVDRAVRQAERGFITVYECMGIIYSVFSERF